MKTIKINKKMVEIVSEIMVDGVLYPITPWNIKKAEMYLETKDEKYIDELKD